MALDPTALETPGTPEFWMTYMASLLLDRYRALRLGRLQAYLSGCPPMLNLAASDRRGWYRFHELSRTNMARKVIRAKADRMKIRSIRTAASTDDRGDVTAWRYFTRSGLPAASKLVHSDQLTFNEGYVRVSLAADGTPVALRRDPRFCIAIDDPLDPLRTLAGFELLWDEFTNTSYAYLWIRGTDETGQPAGQQWVASAPDVPRPRAVSIPGMTADVARRFGWWWPQLFFDASRFTMRPHLENVPENERDGGPYCQTLAADVVPLFRFPNRDDTGEFEEHTDVLDRINRTICDRVILQAIQAYRQRALQQDVPADGIATDRLPTKDPKTQEPIQWDQIYQPGPDALWKLPPGVKIWESQMVDLSGALNAAKDDLRTLSAATDTPLPMLSDDVNQSAEGAQYNREGLIFGIEDCMALAAAKWQQVIACMFLFAPDSDRYAPGGRGNKPLDRSDASQILIDWAPPERFSLAERADADSKNKTLSLDMAAAKIWGLSPDEVAINREQRKADLAEIPMQFRPSILPQNEAANEAAPAPPAEPAAAPAATDAQAS